MPELPEVETIRLGLERVIISQEIRAVQVSLPKMVRGAIAAVIGSTITAIGRRGKLLVLRTNGEYSILIHLKMTGQLVLESLLSDKVYPNKSTHVIFEFMSGERLFFNDTRTFGYVLVLKTVDLEQYPFLRKLGVEPFDARFTLPYLEGLAKRFPRMNCKLFLLDQTKIAGLGNIYVDESLFRAGILPTRKVGSLTKSELSLLYAGIISVLHQGVRLGGSSRTNYITVDGSKGDFLNEANVYMREGLSCRVCGFPIQKTKFAGRGTHYCHNCQR